MQEETKIIHSVPIDALTGAISVPIYQTSTFVQEAPGINQGFDYSRTNNPTRKTLENLIAIMEGGDAGFAFASGLAAVDVVVKLLSTGDEIVAVDDIYGGTFRQFTHIYQKFGISIKYVDTSDIEIVKRVINSNTKLIWIESPTNPTLKISDIESISKLAHEHNALVVVDNTFASPYLQKPLKLGADIVIHSGTKYLAGHSDLIAGLVVTKSPELSEQIKFLQNATGSILGPFDSWLCIRGIETLPLRMEKQSQNGFALAKYLSKHSEIDQVYYPGLETHKNYRIAQKQQKAFAGVISITLKEDLIDNAITFVKSTKLFKLAESLGGVKSLICHPASMTHKSTPPEVRANAGVTDSLIRLSCGIENERDLIEDVEQALDKVASVQFTTV